MKARRGAVLVGLAGVLALTWGLPSWLEGVGRVPLAAPVSQVPLMVPLAAGRHVRVDERMTISVIDDVTERPIANARLLRDCGGRSLDASEPIAVSDQTGELVLPCCGLLARVCVVADGYVANEFSGTEAGATVRLQPASRLDVRCEFEDGSPAAGTLVSLARTAPAADPLPAGSGLPRPGVSGVAVGVTDATGWVSLDGLDEGTWWPSATHDSALSEAQHHDGVRVRIGQRGNLRIRLRRLVGFEATVLGGECVAHRLTTELARYEFAGQNMQQVVRSTWLLHRATPTGTVRDAWLIGGDGLRPDGKIDIELLIAERGWVRRTVDCSLWSDRTTQVIDVSSAASRTPGNWFSWSGNAIGPARVLLASGELVWVDQGQRTWLPAGEHRLADAFDNECDPGVIAVTEASEPIHATLGYGDRRALQVDVRMPDGSKPLWARAVFRRMLTEHVGGDSSAPVWYGSTCRVFEAGTERVLVRAGLLGAEDTDREVALTQAVTQVQLTLRYP